MLKSACESSTAAKPFQVVLFLDVDGVLNADWHGLGLGRREDLTGLVDLEPSMLSAFKTLLSRIQAEVAPVRSAAAR